MNRKYKSSYIKHVASLVNEYDDLEAEYITGPRWVAVEITIRLAINGKTLVITTQGLSKTHWRDKHNPALGVTMARGRAAKQAARIILGKFSYTEAVSALTCPPNKRIPLSRMVLAA